MSDITIIMPSFNKEKYISEALNSVFAQETSYDYHIVVADDCSTDKTIDIVQEYQEKYPNKITLLTSEKNQKLYRNVLRAYERTKTDYFCVLDPDDYWVDEHKIQKALDFLEKNQDYTIYVTNTEMLLSDGSKKNVLSHDKIIDSDFEDYLNKKAVLGNTLGSIFRNTVFKNGIPDKMKNLECETMEQSFRGDTFRNILHLHCGKAHYVPETDSVYRITEDGIWQGISTLEQDIINANTFKDLWLYFDKKYPQLLDNSHKVLNTSKVQLLDKLFRINDAEKLQNFIEKLKKLKAFYADTQDIREQYLRKSLKPKYKFMLYLYKKIHKKLSRKGLI